MRPIFFASALFLGAVNVAMAEQPATPQTQSSSIAALVNQGYEFKTSVYIPVADRKAADNKDYSQGMLMITLQRGTSFAVCSLSWGAWSWLKPEVLNQGDVCEVR